MLGPWAWRAWRGALGAPRGSPCTQRRSAHVAQAAHHVGPVIGSLLSRLGLGLGAGASGLLTGAWLASSKDSEGSELSEQLDTLSFVVELKARARAELAAPPGAQLRKETQPMSRLLGVDKDHLFQSLIQSQQVREFRCFYEQPQQVSEQDQVTGARFHSVVQLGKDVCGFPQTVHGGLTAALIDETLGGLSLQLWRHGLLGLRTPAYTARLEVDYKCKIPAGSVILVTTEVEQLQGRKVWMRARVTDGGSMEYAAARALFVAPRMPGEALTEKMQKRLGGLLPGSGTTPSTLA